VAAIDLPVTASHPVPLLHRAFAQAIEAVADYFGGVDAVIAHSFGAAGVTLALSRSLRLRRAVFFAPPARFERIWQASRRLGISGPVWQRMVRRSSPGSA